MTSLEEVNANHEDEILTVLSKAELSDTTVLCMHVVQFQCQNQQRRRMTEQDAFFEMFLSNCQALTADYLSVSRAWTR